MVAIAFPLTLEFKDMPLAVYRELQAHLRQLRGLGVDLIPQQSPVFAYHRSQIGGISLVWNHSHPFPEREQQYLKQILSYYSDRYPLVDSSILKQL